MPPLIVMDPIVARLFVDLGFDTKEKLIALVCRRMHVMPAREYWDDQWVQTLTLPLAVAGVEPYATKLKAAPDELVQDVRAEGPSHRRRWRRDPGSVQDDRWGLSRQGHGLD